MCRPSSGYRANANVFFRIGDNLTNSRVVFHRIDEVETCLEDDVFLERVRLVKLLASEAIVHRFSPFRVTI